MHLDLRVPAAGRLVIDAFAGPVDIALDGTVGRGRDGSRRGGQENRVGARGWLGGAENGRLLVADAPVPRRDERALPHPGLGLARLLLVGIVVMGKPRIGQGPAVSHQPFLNVLAVDFTPRHGAAAAVDDLTSVTGPALVVGMLDELVARGNPAGPALALGVEAKLIPRRRVDPAKADSRVADLDVVALADLRYAGDLGGLRHRRQQQHRHRKQESYEHREQAVFNAEPYSMSNRINLTCRLWCGFGSGASTRRGRHFQLTAMADPAHSRHPRKRVIQHSRHA